MTADEQVYEVLIGLKVKDDAGLWHVYDADGNEISDPGGILLRGSMGAIITWPQVIEEIIWQDARGYWKNLYKPVQNAVVETTTVRSKSSVKFVRPTTTTGVENAQVYLTGLRSKGKAGNLTLSAHSGPQLASVRGSSTAARLKVRGSTRLFPHLASGLARVGAAVISGGTSVKCRSLRGSGLIDTVVVKTIQNPTPEMLTILFS